MNNEDIDYTIKSINKTLSNHDIAYKKMLDDKTYTGTNANWLKGHVFPEIVAELSAELMLVRDQLELERRHKMFKKFWQFWK